jgi:hypothetical protein
MPSNAITCRKGVLEQSGFKIAGTYYTARAPVMKQTLKRAGLSKGSMGSVSGKPVVLAYSREKVSCVIECDKKHDAAQDKEAIEHFTRAGRELSLLSGLEVVIVLSLEATIAPRRHLHHARARYPARQITVVVGSSPPGETKKYTGKKVCGVYFRDDEAEYQYMAVTRGRGQYITDSDGVPAAQLVDQTLYLFAPAQCRAGLKALTTCGDLFGKLLRTGWNAIVDGFTKKARLLPIKNEQGYREVLYTIDKMLLSDVGRQLKEIDDELETLRSRYTALQIRRHSLHEVRNTWKDKPLYGPSEDRGEAWRVLASIKELASFSWDARTFQLKTRMIVQEYGGNLYALGTFGARLDIDGLISVWCEETLHPHGAPHPHISKHGSVCFGNIDFELRDAMAEGRISDAVTLLIRWLTSGYDPRVADTKIEEWPKTRR